MGEEQLGILPSVPPLRRFVCVLPLLRIPSLQAASLAAQPTDRHNYRIGINQEPLRTQCSRGKTASEYRSKTSIHLPLKLLILFEILFTEPQG